MTAADFERVLAGENHQVIKIRHPWLTAFAQNDDGHAALLIRASLRPDQIVPDGRGFVVKTQRDSSHDYISISAREAGAPAMFLRLVDYLLERTGAATSLDGSIASLIRAIEEFKRFSSRHGGRLSAEEIRGLTAELLLLRRFLSTGVPADLVLTAWKGPFAGDGVGIHDFTFASGRGIEVKSTHQPALEVRVSSSQQLVPSAEQLDLLVLPIEELPTSSSKGVQFRELLRDTADVIRETSSTAYFTWERAMGALGLDIEDEFYDGWRFEPGRWIRYVIREGFPYLLPSALPPGLVKISYSLELQHLSGFEASYDDLIEELANEYG